VSSPTFTDTHQGKQRAVRTQTADTRKGAAAARITLSPRWLTEGISSCGPRLFSRERFARCVEKMQARSCRD
jgi:hypothetical protein